MAMPDTPLHGAVVETPPSTPVRTAGAGAPRTPVAADSALSSPAAFATPGNRRLKGISPTSLASPTRPLPLKPELTTVPLTRSSRAIGALAFVDRDNEAFELARANLRNKRLPNSNEAVTEHPTLITAGQLFGAGKSQMGRHAVARVRAAQGAGEKEVWQRLLKEGLSNEEVMDYANAVTVTVDLTAHSPTFFLKLDAYLGYALHESLRCSAPTKSLVVWPRIEECDFKLTLSGVVNRFYEATHCSIFIHFDEVGALETGKFDGCVGWPVVFDRTELRPLLSRYYDFWDVVHPLLRMEHVYTFVTGKQTVFALLGYGLLQFTGGRTSPTRHLHLVLGALTWEDIWDTYEETRLYDSRAPLNTHFGTATDELLEVLCKRICLLTAGLPRMVHACLEALCQLQDACLVLQSSEEIDTALEKVYKHITGRGTESGRGDLYRHLMCSPEAKNGPLSGAYSALLLASLLDLSMDASNGLLALSTGEQLPLLRVVDKLDVFLDSHGCKGDLVRVRFAKWTMRHLVERRKELDACLYPVLPLWEVPPEVLGKGEPLEWLVRTRLSFVLQLGPVFGGKAKTWAEVFAVFHGTMLAERKAPVLDAQQPVRIIPRVVREVAQCDLLGGWSGTIGTADWGKLFGSGAFPPDTVGYPAPQSHSPDVIVRCGTDLVAAFQCKLGDSATTWSTVQEEIEKTAPLIKVTKGGCDVCLVLVAFTLGVQLQEAFHEGDATKLVVTAGKWALADKKLERLLNHDNTRASAGKKVVLSVPDKMQLVVLGNAGLRSFLGDESVQALRELISTRRNSTTDPIDSLQLSMSLLSTHKGALARTAPLEQRLAQLSLGPGGGQPLPPFALESFLRDETKIDDDGVKEYLPLLKKNKVDEAGLHLIEDKDLCEWGITAGLDRKKILAAIKKRVGKC